MTSTRRAARVLVMMGVGALVWGCSWGVHLWPDRYDWVTGERTAPAAVQAARAALAGAKAAGAERVAAARYPLAKAAEYLQIAETELAWRDFAAAETSAGIAKKAAEEATAIAQRGG